MVKPRWALSHTSAKEPIGKQVERKPTQQVAGTSRAHRPTTFDAVVQPVAWIRQAPTSFVNSSARMAIGPIMSNSRMTHLRSGNVTSTIRCLDPPVDVGLAHPDE